MEHTELFYHHRAQILIQFSRLRSLYYSISYCLSNKHQHRYFGLFDSEKCRKVVNNHSKFYLHGAALNMLIDCLLFYINELHSMRGLCTSQTSFYVERNDLAIFTQLCCGKTYPRDGAAMGSRTEVQGNGEFE